MALRYTVDFARFVCGTDTIYLNYIIFPRLRQSLKLYLGAVSLSGLRSQPPNAPFRAVKNVWVVL